MNDDDLLFNLEELVVKSTICLRYEMGDFKGGLYRYNQKEQFLINKDLSVKQKINILAFELKKKLDFDDLYLVPALREVIENASGMA